MTKTIKFLSSEVESYICILYNEKKYTLSSEESLELEYVGGEALIFTEGEKVLTSRRKILIFLLRAIASILRVVFYDTFEDWFGSQEPFMLSIKQELDSDTISIIHTQTKFRLGSFYVKKPNLEINGKTCDAEVLLDTNFIETAFFKEISNIIWMWMYFSVAAVLLGIFSGVTIAVCFAVIVITFFTVLFFNRIKQLIKKKKETFSFIENS